MKNKNIKPIAALILAAGQGKRMMSEKSKVLHKVLGKPMLYYPVKVAFELNCKNVCVVTPSNNEDIKSFLNSMKVETVVQKKPMGTADAVISSKNYFSNFDGYLMILSGDTPLLKSSTLKKFAMDTMKSGSICGLCTMKLSDGGNYGRIIRDFDGKLARIVEKSDANQQELTINEVNTGVYCVDSKWLFETLKNISKENVQGEYYLTDIIQIAVQTGETVHAFLCEDSNEFLGVNNRRDLDLVVSTLRKRINEEHQLNGVTIVDSEQTYIETDVVIDRDVEIYPFTFIKGKTKIEKGTVIDNGVVISDSYIGNNVHIKPYTLVESSKIKDNSVIGPFARIRPDSVVCEGCKIGNFVEVKKSTLRKNVKASHLSYLGDADIGEGTNIGCGTITCNYDGVNKYKTKIGKNVFVGSDTQFIAPVNIGDNSLVAAGTTVTKTVPADSLVLSRVEQIVKKGWAKKRKGGK